MGWIAVNRLLFSAVLPGRLYKIHTPCINYHFRKKMQKLLWLCTLSFPLSTPWHLFRMICLFVFFFSSRLIPPSSISGVYLSSGRGCQFLPTLYRRVGWIAVNRLLCADHSLLYLLHKSKFEVNAFFSSSDFNFISFFFTIELAKSWLAYYISLFILLNTEIISFTLFLNVSLKLFKLDSKATAIIILSGLFLLPGGRFDLKTCIWSSSFR